jgi:hypothetical protein
MASESRELTSEVEYCAKRVEEVISKAMTIMDFLVFTIRTPSLNNRPGLAGL